jgi:hypothetical protein
MLDWASGVCSTLSVHRHYVINGEIRVVVRRLPKSGRPVLIIIYINKSTDDICWLDLPVEQCALSGGTMWLACDSTWISPVH